MGFGWLDRGGSEQGLQLPYAPMAVPSHCNLWMCEALDAHTWGWGWGGGAEGKQVPPNRYNRLKLESTRMTPVSKMLLSVLCPPVCFVYSFFL